MSEATATDARLTESTIGRCETTIKFLRDCHAFLQVVKENAPEIGGDVLRGVQTADRICELLQPLVLDRKISYTDLYSTLTGRVTPILVSSTYGPHHIEDLIFLLEVPIVIVLDG